MTEEISMQTITKLFAQALAVVAATFDTIVQPQVAFADGNTSQASFADNLQARKDAMGLSVEIEVRDPKTVAMLTGQGADMTTTARAGWMVDDGEPMHGMASGATTATMTSDDTAQFGRVRH